MSGYLVICSLRQEERRDLVICELTSRVFLDEPWRVHAKFASRGAAGTYIVGLSEKQKYGMRSVIQYLKDETCTDEILNALNHVTEWSAM